MSDNRFYRYVPYIKGNTSRQAHSNLPKNNDGKVTYEEEHGRLGFFGKVSHLYHINPPTGYTKIEGEFKPELIDTNKLTPKDQHDPWDLPVYFLENNEVKLGISRRSKEMPYYLKETLNDLIYFVHKGHGNFQTLYGILSYKQGDYIIIPKGTPFKIIPETEENYFLVIESDEEIQIPDRGLLGPTALYDPATIEVPEPNPLSNGGKGTETIVRHKRMNKYTDYYYDFDIGRNVIGWKGDVTPWKINIHDFRPIMSHRYHLPPSAHTTFLTNGFVVCSFVPRLFETEEGVLKIPFYHSNVEYDEVIFYHAGKFFSRDNIDSGMVTFHPAGFLHGPHPKALQKMLKQDKKMTDEYAVMVDTRNPLNLTKEAREIIDERYYKSWLGAKFEGEM
ncbi:MAG: Homogentisate 1,2-dioxygenase [Candidatus Heimdallarchaeota archaeon LC_3]|nr:MAG: Homogentisate 1,2-dioxygenase [Candidatus Heimdallarchaeota archaeon LC_3]